MEAPLNERPQASRDLRQMEDLERIFPTLCPLFLRMKAIEFRENKGGFYQWINETLEGNLTGLPQREDYEKRQQETAQLERHSKDASAEEILEMYEGDPEKYFSDPKRISELTNLYHDLASAKLKLEFEYASVAAISCALRKSNGVYFLARRILISDTSRKRKTRRTQGEVKAPTDTDLEFLKETQWVRALEDSAMIRARKTVDRESRIEMAKAANALWTCDCCADDECLDDDMMACTSGHFYCKTCIVRAFDVALGDGRTSLTCLMHCEAPFPEAPLRSTVGGQKFDKWMTRVNQAAIDEAHLDELEQCPFCHFALIMDAPKEVNKIFKCQSPDCGKESCRLCQKPSHLPLKCSEVEQDEETKKRTMIEDKMTEALIRLCYQCKRPYIKLDGCNKITCSHCGAQMCYLCRKPVVDYKHFAGQGAGTSTKCPLWTNMDEVHQRDVARGALDALEQAKLDQPDVELKHNPAAGINLDMAKAEIRLVDPPPVADHHPIGQAPHLPIMNPLRLGPPRPVNPAPPIYALNPPQAHVAQPDAQANQRPLMVRNIFGLNIGAFPF